MPEIVVTSTLKHTVPLFELLTVGEPVTLTEWQAKALTSMELSDLTDTEVQEYLVGRSYLCENGCAVDDDAFEAADEWGRGECLAYLEKLKMRSLSN